MEGFWSSLKRELVHGIHLATQAEAKVIVFEWIKILCDRKRFRSAPGYKPPVDLETQLQNPCLDVLTRHLSTKPGQGQIDTLKNGE